MQNILSNINPMFLSSAILILVYAFLISEKINQAVIALLGGFAMIYLGILTQEKAIEYIDFNTIFLLIGMMIIVNITAKTGLFQYVAIFATKTVKASPVGILLVLCLIVAFFSAFLDNVTTVLLITPVTLLITEQLKIPAYPYLFATIISSNVGGTATLIGDPPNILVGSKTHLTFNDFLIHLTPIALILMVALIAIFWLMFKKNLKADEKIREKIMKFDERSAITDQKLLKKCLTIFSLVLLGFFFGHKLNLEPGTVALSGATLLILLSFNQKDNEKIHHAFAEVEWVTIFFFLGLFIVVGGVDSSGILKILGDKLINATQGDLFKMTFLILWVSAILSSFLNNIPFIATMIPLLQQASETIPQDKFEVVWWALLLGACLGGNGTIIGASANVTVASFAEKAKQPISMLQFAKTAFPLMIFTIIISSIYLWLRYF